MLSLAPPATSCDTGSAHPVAVWVDHGGDRVVQMSDADPALDGSLEAEASLGGLSTRWTTALPAPDSAGALSATVEDLRGRSVRTARDGRLRVAEVRRVGDRRDHHRGPRRAGLLQHHRGQHPSAAVLLGGDTYDAHLAHLDKVNH